MAGDSKYSVLIVEDDPDLMRMIYKILEPIVSVATASDGEEAFDLMKGGWIPSLVITDVMMPRMDGLTLAQSMKKSPDLVRVPIIFLTAKASAKDVVAGINAGARHYLTKPFKPDELLGKVKKILNLL